MLEKIRENGLKTFIMLLIIGLPLSCTNDNNSKGESIITEPYNGSVKLTHNGILREYYVYVPKSYNTLKIIALLIASTNEAVNNN
jgi:hypothetical protein